MLHTKAMISDSVITLGSTNINKKAFKQLSELNIFIKNEDTIRTALITSVQENIALSQRIDFPEQLRYNKFNALCEGMLM